MTLGDSNFLGDQLETHLHFPLSLIIDIHRSLRSEKHFLSSFFAV